jgi:hypothetical protein
MPKLPQAYTAPGPRRRLLLLQCLSAARLPCANYRVVLKLDGDEFEIGSIGIQHGAAWRWGIDTVIPMRSGDAREGKNRRDCMRQFKAAWERFASDEANLVEFMNAKRKRR